jgi:uncharacterized RDD family membrane protein YckC
MSPLEISSRYDSSILVRRWIGCWVDYALLIGAWWLAQAGLSDKSFRLAVVPLLLLSVLYFLILEGVRGRTIGQVLAGLTLVDEFGLKPGIYRAFLRTCCRMIEANPFLVGGLPAGVIVAVTRTHQSVGDMIARTFVVKTKDLPLLLLGSESNESSQASIG